VCALRLFGTLKLRPIRYFFSEVLEFGLLASSSRFEVPYCRPQAFAKVSQLLDRRTANAIPKQQQLSDTKFSADTLSLSCRTFFLP